MGLMTVKEVAAFLGVQEVRVERLERESLLVSGKRIKWLILPLHESETDRHLIGLSG